MSKLHYENTGITHVVCKYQKCLAEQQKREREGTTCEDEGCPHYGTPHAHGKAAQQKPVAITGLNYLYWCAYHVGHHDTVEGRYKDVSAVDRFDYWQDRVQECIESGDMPLYAAMLTKEGK